MLAGRVTSSHALVEPCDQPDWACTSQRCPVNHTADGLHSVTADWGVTQTLARQGCEIQRKGVLLLLLQLYW